MPLKMKANTATSTQQFDAEPGTYEFILNGASIDLGTSFDDPTVTYPQMRLVWVDENGESFYDSFIRVPLGFKLNDKAKLTNRYAALIGRPLTEPDAELLEITLSDDSIDSYDALHAAVKNGAKIEVTELTFSGKSLFGRPALLTLGHNKSGRPVCGANGAAPVPRKAPKKVAAAPAPAPAAPADDGLDF